MLLSQPLLNETENITPQSSSSVVSDTSMKRPDVELLPHLKDYASKIMVLSQSLSDETDNITSQSSTSSVVTVSSKLECSHIGKPLMLLILPYTCSFLRLYVRRADHELLTTIVAQYFAIIENKKSDSLTINQKNEAWDKVAEDFNCATNNLKRTGSQLRNAYNNNFKKKLKKESVEDKIDIYKTGGGVALSQKMMEEEKSRLLSLLQPQMEPIQSKFDSSANYIVKDRQTTNEFEDTAADDVEEISDENNPPQHVQLSRKKRNITNVYELINTYTKKNYKRVAILIGN
ncbi:hypothetical protein FQA39_LY16036 [Lamprigera yunnana]|nr:hypothetical protein FQA39_LY16036 [Lamprigera yunnana]